MFWDAFISKCQLILFFPTNFPTNMTSLTFFILQLEDSNKKYCRDLDEIRRDKDEMNLKIKALAEDLDKAQSTSSNQGQEREQLKKQLADEKLKKIQVYGAVVLKNVRYFWQKCISLKYNHSYFHFFTGCEQIGWNNEPKGILFSNDEFQESERVGTQKEGERMSETSTGSHTGDIINYHPSKEGDIFISTVMCLVWYYPKAKPEGNITTDTSQVLINMISPDIKRDDDDFILWLKL